MASAHPEFGKYYGLLAGAGEKLFTKWSGDVFRSTAPRWISRPYRLTGVGAVLRGGRWNVRHLIPAVCFSTTAETVAAEADAKARKYGWDPAMMRPQTRIGLKVQFHAMLDLTAPEVLKALELESALLTGCDWDGEQEAKREAVTQAVSRAAFECMAEGFLVPSARQPYGGECGLFSLPQAGCEHDSYLRGRGYSTHARPLKCRSACGFAGRLESLYDSKLIMAPTVKEMPTMVAPELEVVHANPTEEHVQAGTFPGAAIEGGIAEIVVSTNPLKTDFPLLERIKAAMEGTDVPVELRSIPSMPSRRVSVKASVKPVISEEKSAEELEKSLSSKLVTEISSTEPDVKTLCDTYGLKREELGRMTGFSLRALAEWSTGKLPSQPAKRRLREIRRLLDALAEIVKLDAIPHWLHQSNPAFDEMTPLQVIEVGEIDRLWAMVHDLGSGHPE